MTKPVWCSLGWSIKQLASWVGRALYWGVGTILEPVLLAVLVVITCFLILVALSSVCNQEPIPATYVLPEGAELLRAWGNHWYLIDAHGDTFLVVERIGSDTRFAITRFSREEL